jgi:hypothetical protein
MHRATLGILAGIVGSALGTVWWRRHRARIHSQDSPPAAAEPAPIDYERLAEGII